jgi:methyltransferase (TIGR00027 family)
MIENVSDTALWVAMYRAMESERPDALFNDPFARELAGAQGEQILRQLKGSKSMAWVLAVRTQVIDEMILQSVRELDVDCVLNLACGLDTRPYRLPLPAALRWVEADLPAMLHYKEEGMGKEAKPVCQLERIGVDLADGDARRKMLDSVFTASRKVLVLTEGLLCYLHEEDVWGLARDLRAHPKAALWITDLFSADMIASARKTWGKQLERANAAIRFGTAPEAFAPLGWKPRRVATMIGEGYRLKRQFPGAFLWRPLLRIAPAPIRNFFESSYQIVWFEAA